MMPTNNISLTSNDTIRKWSLFILSFVTVCLSSGLIYGWPSLRRNLIEVSNTSLTEQQLGGVYTIGAWSTQGGRFLFGIGRDRFGTKITCLVALFAVIGGCIGTAVCDANNVVSLSISVFCIGLGSGGQLCLQPVASLFKRSGTIIASLSGAFQVSGLMFLIVLSITSIRLHAFIGLAIVIFVLSIFAGIMLPMGSSFVVVNNDDRDATLGRDSTRDTGEEQKVKLPDVLEEEEAEECQEANTSLSLSLQSKLNRLKAILVQKEYILLIVWFSTCIVPLQYYIGIIGYSLEMLGDDNGFYTDLFSILYASAAALAPFGGYLADRLGLGLTQGLATSLCATSFYFLALGSLQAQVPGMCLYSVGRMLIFGMYFSNIGKRFGYENYGLLAGLGLLLSAIISLIQYPLITLAIEGSAREVNLISGSILLLVGIPYCLWLGLVREKEKDEQHDNVESEQSTTRRTPIRQSSRFQASFLRRPSYFAQ